MIRVSSSSSDDEKESPRSKEPATKDPAVSRRKMLGAALAFAAVLVVSGISAVARSLISPGSPPSPESIASQEGIGTRSSSSEFPRMKVANLNDLQAGKWISFNYPLEETPNILVRLGQGAEGGVGPDGDIVAFSQICQHLGCIYGYVSPGTSPACNSSYTSSGPVGYCCCHGSVYDLTKGAKVLGGPSPRAQPQVILEFDSSTGDIYAKGMTPPTIFGHNTGSNDVSNDLQNGTLVSG
jgi:arsenite oxidase small subunit